MSLSMRRRRRDRRLRRRRRRLCGGFLHAGLSWSRSFWGVDFSSFSRVVAFSLCAFFSFPTYLPTSLPTYLQPYLPTHLPFPRAPWSYFVSRFLSVCHSPCIDCLLPLQRCPSSRLDTFPIVSCAGWRVRWGMNKNMHVHVHVDLHMNMNRRVCVQCGLCCGGGGGGDGMGWDVVW